MKKDKGVAFESASPNGSEGSEDKPEDANLRPFRFAARNASSKYDFVKVFFFFQILHFNFRINLIHILGICFFKNFNLCFLG